MEDRIVSDRRSAPTLMVEYVCPKCGVRAVLDAYNGPPTCSGGAHPKAFMEGASLSIARQDPLADIDAMRMTPRRYA